MECVWQLILYSMYNMHHISCTTNGMPEDKMKITFNRSSCLVIKLIRVLFFFSFKFSSSTVQVCSCSQICSLKNQTCNRMKITTKKLKELLLFNINAYIFWDDIIMKASLSGLISESLSICKHVIHKKLKVNQHIICILCFKVKIKNWLKGKINKSLPALLNG